MIPKRLRDWKDWELTEFSRISPNLWLRDADGRLSDGDVDNFNRAWNRNVTACIILKEVTYSEILGDDDAAYILSHDAEKGDWEMTFFEQRTAGFAAHNPHPT